MDQLFDSLSEDWVSQPRSPRSSQAQQSSVVNSPFQSSNASQSRIPRYQSRTSSRLSSDRPEVPRRRSSAPSNEAKKLPLSEKTSSTLNTFNNKSPPDGSLKINGASPISVKAPKQRGAKGSVRSLPHDTVQHKPSQPSPLKAQANNGTPDWKRRLKSNTGSGVQQDLFSPIGLESVFRPPTVKNRGDKKKGPRYQPIVTDEVPSSPPSLPSAVRKVPEKATKGEAHDGELPTRRTEDTNKGLGKERTGLREEEYRPGAPEKDPRAEVAQLSRNSSQRLSEGPGNRLSDPQSPHMTPRLPSYNRQSRSTPEIPKTSQNRKEPQIDSDHGAPSERSRVTSGQTADCNEDLSPFFVSRQHTVDGRVDYAPVVDMNQVRKRISDLRLHQQQRPSSPSSDDGIIYARTHSPAACLGKPIPDSDTTSHSLPEDLSTGTQSFVANGGFVNARRGGRSQEGSFLRRPLSPPSSPFAHSARSDCPVPPPELSVLHSQNGKVVDYHDPATPKHPDNDANSSERPRWSGSPLKLFDKYDTFTNNRLQRQMSKFEETVPNSVDEANSLDQSQVENELAEEANEVGHMPRGSRKNSGSHFSSFGEGELDDHGFESFPSRPFGERDTDDREELHKSNHKPRDFCFMRHSEQKPTKDSLTRLQESTPSVALTNSKDAQEPPQHEFIVEEDITRTINGKRLPYSPAKNPKPKRRRTLRSSEEADIEPLRTRQDSTSTTAPTSSVLGRKRKDALYDSNVQIADPKVLAMRQILRPRNPTPSQSASYVDLPRQSTRIAEPMPHQSFNPEADEHDKAKAPTNPPTQRLAGNIANLAFDMAKELSESARKPSVNTADFFNEAQQIMQLIRSRGRPVSEGITEEGSTADSGNELDESIYPESTKEEFSRPPSREGGSLRRLRQPAKLDARLVSRLRKFEEKTDVGMTLSSSLKSLKMGQPNDTAMTIELKDIARKQNEDIESDHNVRIIERQRHHSSSETVIPVLPTDTQAQSFGSHSTSGPSTGQSNPTNSSRGSRNKAVIAPETVAHLLSDQVAGMTFDHERQVWVKSRTSSKADVGEDDGNVENEMTDDELGAIPDLSVDEIEELRRIKLAESPRKVVASVSDLVAHFDHAAANQKHAPSSDEPAPSNSRPQTADGMQTSTHDASSAPSKFSYFVSSGPVPETRATSWGDEALDRERKQSQASNHRNSLHHPKDEYSGEVEHEISILEGRVSVTPIRTSHQQPRAVTVTFSSPLVDQIEASYFHNQESVLQEDASGLELDNSPIRKVSNTKNIPMGRRTSSGFGRKSAYRRLSVGNQSYIARPMSRLDEQDETSMIHVPNAGSLTTALTTPLPAQNSALIVPATGATSSSVTFQLSPLPDFSVHQTDRPLDNVNAAQSLQICSAQQAERRVSQATQEMVKKITDVEPYEPYWDYLRALDLHERSIASLHMLSDFCGRLEELDVSGNQLRELTGAPFTLRHLRIRQNCLSNLTAWNHLNNLQYLDVSGNQLQNMNGFQSLVHLRELRLDDNQIQNIDGILGLDGLIRLSLKRNQIEHVDFGGSELKRLTDLDLRGNKLFRVSGLHQLPALKHLHLGDNKLSRFETSSLSSLETLNLASNDLTNIDLLAIPNLRTLNLDHNSISSITSLSSLRSLHTLCWRNQNLSRGSKIEYQSSHNLTHLHLSGNTLSEFAPVSPFFNLQTLELASTGLQTLSEDFGLQCPNLRTLNLNHNALRDLRPLLNIARLERLHLAGNRIERLRRTAAVVDRIGKDLAEVDLRNNPLTVGFYTPPSSALPENAEKQIIVPQTNHSDPSDEEPWCSDADDERVAQAYLLPPSDTESDKISRDRLDEDTKLRRRVYEMLLVSACPALQTLDGLQVCREDIVRRDGIWDRLVELDVLKPKGDQGAQKMIEAGEGPQD